MLQLYTIGHSNLEFARFLEALRQFSITRVVDVRTSPFSRYTPHFNRKELEETLQEAGIHYVYLGDALGGRPSDPAMYRSGCVPESREDYLRCVDYPLVARQTWFSRGVEELLCFAAQGRAAIMCSEENPDECHRHHLIEVAIGDRAEVHHIRTSKGRIREGVTSYQRALF